MEAGSRYIDETNLKYCWETNRLKTFIKWNTKKYGIMQSLLSKAGFVYTGKSDTAQCFACGLRASNWYSKGNPLTYHTELSPSCNFHILNEPLKQDKFDSCFLNGIEAILENKIPSLDFQLSEFGVPLGQKKNRRREAKSLSISNSIPSLKKLEGCGLHVKSTVDAEDKSVTKGACSQSGNDEDTNENNGTTAKVQGRYQ